MLCKINLNFNSYQNFKYKSEGKCHEIFKIVYV